MWDNHNLPFQVRPVGSLGGIAAPCIVACQFALNKVIAYFRNRHWKRTSLQRICANLSQQSRNCFAGRIRLRVLANCPDHSLAVDAFSMRPSVCHRNCQTSGPRFRPLLIRLLCCIPASLHRSCDAEEFSRKDANISHSTVRE